MRIADALYAQSLGLPLLVRVERENGIPDNLLVLAWETGRLSWLLSGHDRDVSIPDWATPSWDAIRGYCDDCARSARVRTHRGGCSHAFPIPITPPVPVMPEPGPGQVRVPNRRGVSIRLEEAVQAARARGCLPLPRDGGRTWRCQCPLCRARGRVDRRVEIKYDPIGPKVRIRCFSDSHSTQDLVEALDLVPSRREIRQWKP